MTLVATIVLFAVWVLRWIDAGHFPLFGMWEASLSLALALLIAANFTRRRALLLGIAALVLAQGALYDKRVWALTISERSLVVDVHAILAWAAFAILTANAAIALHVIVKRDDAPSLVRTLKLGFFLYTAMIATGMLYNFLLFGVVWSFDPIETLAMSAWIAYATLLHLAPRWDSRRLAKACAGVFLLLVVSYRAIVLFPPASTYHIFDIDLRVHRVAEVRP